MSTKNTHKENEPVPPFKAKWAWKGGAVAGLVATVAMGLATSVVQLSTLRLAITGLYGFEGSLVVGWVTHLAHSTLFGIIFAGLMADPCFFQVSDSVLKSIVAAAGYGFVFAVAGAGIIMPIWLGLAGFPTPRRYQRHASAPSLAWNLRDRPRRSLSVRR